MNFKKLESGRSMVEMLGVLAIIGVLSVGGIAGYSLSMRRHRANGVVDYVSKYAIGLYSECQRRILEGILDGERCNMYNANSGVSDTDTVYPDVGPVPSGVEFVVLTDIIYDNSEMTIDVGFHDQKLCQAVASVSGSVCSNKRVAIKIKQN